MGTGYMIYIYIFIHVMVDVMILDETSRTCLSTLDPSGQIVATANGANWIGIWSTPNGQKCPRSYGLI